MKLIERERVDGTQVTIGKRVYYRDGKRSVSPRYAAEYVDSDGNQVGEGLGTTSKSKARRLAIEIQQRLDAGSERVRESRITVAELVKRYFDSVKLKGAAPKTERKYRTDLDKLEAFCEERGIVLARNYSEESLLRFRQWLVDRKYAPKTVGGALVLAKQVFKWEWRNRLLLEYRLAAASVPKAKARPQPCFTTEQVNQLIDAAAGEEKAAFALMAFAGLRIGEVEQLRWEDLGHRGGQLATLALAGAGGPHAADSSGDESPQKGTFRATGESINEKTPQTLELQELVACLDSESERAGFEPAVQVLYPYAGLANRCFKPLSHLSSWA